MTILRVLLSLSLLLCSCAGSGSDTRSDTTSLSGSGSGTGSDRAAADDPTFVPNAIAPTYDHEELLKNLVYPPEALDAKIQGTVTVTVKLDTAGRIVDATVSKKVHPSLDTAALDAVRKLTFTPGIQNGKPIPMRMMIPVRFTLDE